MIYLQNEEARQFHTMRTAIALGKFDGIHLGHQMLINGLNEEKMKGRQALIFTFGSNPAYVLTGGSTKNIYTSEEKALYFSELGVDILLEYPFTKAFSSISPEDFVEGYLVKQLGVRAVYVGEDFHFGKGRRGNVSLLQSMGAQYRFEVHAMAKKTLHGKVVNSTQIRDMLETHFHIANEMLGNPYFLFGTVIEGKRLGHTIGYPTINQNVPEHKLIPAYGVYASRVLIDGYYYKAISNLGKKPTIEGRHRVGLETHIIGYNGNLYGRELKTELLYFIRPEEKFANVEELRQQIGNDIAMMLENG
ncbi:MAG: bifunctional riboflavin kinase/FAD synthetase [Lachnospiraceae bacterium]|nr:bifunctional riboflavin kinase/FAD synthetase [Lachnospiraceae bacterium]MDE6625073.1 bifunctional riboflavin kinase/FAD synthetase [Lachnospiraceae bacterium]